MNEEMRKEFIKQFLQYTGVNIFFDDHGFPSVDGISIITNVSVQYAWWAWQASREAMKPIKFPSEIDIDLIGDQVANSHANSYAEGYNDALSDLELKITELGYEVTG
jgi:hypothetical protein